LLVALCSGFRVRAVASIHFGGETRLARLTPRSSRRTPPSWTRAPAAPLREGARTLSFAAVDAPGKVAPRPPFKSKNVDRYRFSDGMIP